MDLARTNGRGFGQIHFGSAQLGDARRTARLVSVADQLLRHPQGSFAQKLPNLYDVDAFYRLMAATDLTHASVFDSHRHLTHQRRHVRLLDLAPGYPVVVDPVPDNRECPAFPCIVVRQNAKPCNGARKMV
jgi:hypothetical protein